MQRLLCVPRLAAVRGWVSGPFISNQRESGASCKRPTTSTEGRVYVWFCAFHSTQRRVVKARVRAGNQILHFFSKRFARCPPLIFHFSFNGLIPLQRSLVILTHHSYPALFAAITALLGPLFQEHGLPMLEAACHNIATWCVSRRTHSTPC
jgi:hypothetical protein